MKQNILNLVKKIQSMPGMVLFWIGLAVTIVLVVLSYLGKLTSLRGQQANLQELINDAITRLKIKQNKGKIKDLEKIPETKKDPKEVEDFYKKELK